VGERVVLSGGIEKPIEMKRCDEKRKKDNKGSML
jgi:hypothetical protein